MFWELKEGHCKRSDIHEQVVTSPEEVCRRAGIAVLTAHVTPEPLTVVTSWLSFYFALVR